MVGSGLAAVASAFCFGLAAALQQREALRTNASGVVDPRLLWRLAHRPLWLLGIVADLAAAILQVHRPRPRTRIAGTTAQRHRPALRHRPDGRDAPTTGPDRRPRSGRSGVGRSHCGARHSSDSVPSRPADPLTVALFGGSALLGSLACALAARRLSRRGQALVLAAGAGLAFGVVAVLIRGFIQVLRDRPTATGSLVITGSVLVVLAGFGYLLLQSAYRAGHFAASLGTAAVADPLVAVVGGALVLGEPMPGAGGQLIALVLAGVGIIAGIGLLVRSPAHVFTIEVPDS